MRKFVLLLLLTGLLVASAVAQSTIFIVRHAEKAGEGGNDPDLSEIGRARAETLARMLKDTEITEIYATGFKRTQQTAAPLAKILGLHVTTVSGKGSAEVIAKLRESHGNALVVSHSNIIPELIKGLGITASVSIAENDYDNLFIVVQGQKSRFIRLHY
jgi:broad specificity phosphatase PhoE